MISLQAISVVLCMISIYFGIKILWNAMALFDVLVGAIVLGASILLLLSDIWSWMARS